MVSISFIQRIITPEQLVYLEQTSSFLLIAFRNKKKYRITHLKILGALTSTIYKHGDLESICPQGLLRAISKVKYTVDIAIEKLYALKLSVKFYLQLRNCGEVNFILKKLRCFSWTLNCANGANPVRVYTLTLKQRFESVSKLRIHRGIYHRVKR